MTCAIPVIDLKRADLEAVRAGTEELGAIQVVSHGVPEGLSGDLERRMARLLSLLRAGRPGWPARTRTGGGGSGSEFNWREAARDYRVRNKYHPITHGRR